MDPSEPESLIYSLGIFGSKDPQLGADLGSFFGPYIQARGGPRRRALARDERWRKKLQRGQKKATPQFGSENWQKLRLPTSQVYTLENANSTVISYQNRPTTVS